MNGNKIKLYGKEISGRFTIPSGIVMTEVSTIKRIAEIKEIGILTTKSIGLRPRIVPEGDMLKHPPKGKELANREPIIAQYSSRSFINAVGLTNPGAEEFARRLSEIKIPSDKFLLISIFGKSPEEFRKVAKKLDAGDGFEVNLSCPHSKEYGQVIGQDEELAGKVIKSVAMLGKPVFVKISPNLGVKRIVRCAVDNGASGITAINTRGPEECLYNGYPVLWNKVGGISGKEILELGLKCVREAREVTDLPINACGGISKADDVRRYRIAGADFTGIGTELAGVSTRNTKRYFPTLVVDLREGTNKAERFLKPNLDIRYRDYIVTENRKLADDLFLLRLNKKIEVRPGQFIFAWLPGKGEKPFSVFDDDPLTLLVQNRGCFTNELSKLKVGNALYIKGPFGSSPQLRRRVLVVAGGTGIAAAPLFVKGNRNTIVVLGAKDKDHIPYIKEVESLCEKLYLTTEDGSIGYKGLATDSLDEIIENTRPEYCINCGPEAMVRTAIQKESKYISSEKIYSSIEFPTRCGIGLCGSCATKKGYRSCVDGTFLEPTKF